MTIRRMHLVISNVRAWLHKDAHCGILSVRVSTTLAPFCYLLLWPAGPHGLIRFSSVYIVGNWNEFAPFTRLRDDT